MTSAREEVLARIRRATGPSQDVLTVPREYRRRGHARGRAILDLLTDRLYDYRARVHLTTESEVPAVLRALLGNAGQVVIPHGLPADWSPDQATVDDGFTPSELDGFDAVLTGCAAACAETGTIVLDGSPGQGRRAITLVPDRHVCVVRADQIVETVPELLAVLQPGRTLTFISGPSATSDIELQRVEGVHGPRNLEVVIVTG